MVRAQWFDPLLAFLAEQPPETTSVTLTVPAIAAIVGGDVPRAGLIRGYWRGRGKQSIGPRLAAIGWQVAHVRGRPATITFERLPPETSG